MHYLLYTFWRARLYHGGLAEAGEAAGAVAGGCASGLIPIPPPTLWGVSCSLPQHTKSSMFLDVRFFFQSVR